MESRKVKLKHQSPGISATEGELTGRTRVHGDRTLCQVKRRFTNAQNEKFKKFWGYDRPEKEMYYYQWFPETDLEIIDEKV